MFDGGDAGPRGIGHHRAQTGLDDGLTPGRNAIVTLNKITADEHDARIGAGGFHGDAHMLAGMQPLACEQRHSGQGMLIDRRRRQTETLVEPGAQTHRDS